LHMPLGSRRLLYMRSGMWVAAHPSAAGSATAAAAPAAAAAPCSLPMPTHS
jgi:hypothetical protein